MYRIGAREERLCACHVVQPAHQVTNGERPECQQHLTEAHVPGLRDRPPMTARDCLLTCTVACWMPPPPNLSTCLACLIATSQP